MVVRIDILPARYTDVRHVARGGMGDVYRATDETLGRTVAVKVLAERYADSKDVNLRFKNEALAAARLSGAPYTVTIFDVGEAEGQAFIVMEYLEGGSLEQQLQRGKPDTADTLRWLEQAAAALDAAHAAGVVHRDVKPGNLLLDQRGDVHVADFGVASAVGLDSLTMTGMVLGTAGYLSPEQAQGQRATPASDRYGLAVVAWELLHGRRPFESDNPTAEATAHVTAPIPPSSRELDPVFQRALAKDPKHRYPSASAFVSDLRRPLEPQTQVLATPVSAPRRSFRMPVLALLALLLLLGGGIVVAAVIATGDDHQTKTVVQVTTEQGERTTVERTVTEQPEPPPPPPQSPPAASGKSGAQLTDEATALLDRGRWAEAEVVARQALMKLRRSGEIYEAYAEYDLGRALAEQGKCGEAVQHLTRSERLQGSRPPIAEALSLCQ